MRNTLTVTTPTDRTIVATRTFDAPRATVWKAMTEPALLKRWVFGPPGWEMTRCDEDQRVGGRFHWAWQGPDGIGMTMTGEYRELMPPERCVRTETFEMTAGPPMGTQLATMELVADGDRTHLTVTLEYDSTEARDGAKASGMEHGMAASYDRLEEML